MSAEIKDINDCYGLGVGGWPKPKFGFNGEVSILGGMQGVNDFKVIKRTKLLYYKITKRLKY